MLLKKLRVKISAVAVKPSKKGLGFLKKLLTSKSSYLWEVHNKKHVKDLPYQILRTICKKACPIGSVKRTKCSRETNCKGRTYIYGYTTVGKQCLRTVTKRVWQCCCPKQVKIRQVCFKNRKLLIKTSWVFVNKGCEKSTKKRDISSQIIESCRPKIQHHSGPCEKSNYRTIVTIKRQIINCKCVKLIRKQKVLCRCSRSKRVQVCKKEHNLVKIKLYQTLAKNKCIKRRDMSKVPIICPKSRIETSRCDKITCKRRIQLIKFLVKQCKCQHQLTTIKERCCCPRNKETSRLCQKDRKIFHTSWNTFNRKLKTCVKKSIKKSIRLRCNNKRDTTFGKCDIPYGKVLYKIKQVKWRILKNCKCVKMVRNAKIPCRCTKGNTFKRCTAGGIWKRFSMEYKLIKIKRGKQIVGRCKKVVKVVDESKHRCKKKRKIVYSKCKTLDSTGNKYRMVKILSKVRSGCKCVWTVKRVKELCKCPKGVLVEKCIKDKYKVKLRSWFVILGRGKTSKCTLKTAKISIKIKCPQPTIFRSKCSAKNQKYHVIKTILYAAQKCKCARKFYVRKIRCQLIISGQSHNVHCLDLMPQRACEKLKLKGVCNKPNIHRDKICRKTCGRCSVCPKDSRIAFSIKYHSCLVSDRRYGKRFKLGTVKNSLYKDCILKCKSLSTCKSFDFYIGKRKNDGFCVLNKVNPKQLEISLYPHPMKLGANYKDLNEHHSKRCILSIKECKTKCPQPILKTLTKCKCVKVHGSLICNQGSAISYYVTGNVGHCLRRFWKGLVPCGHDACNNLAAERECHIWQKKGKCKEMKVKKLCQKTCSKCHCSRVQNFITKCDKTNHKMKISLLTAKHRKHGKCIIRITKEKRSCNVCYKRPFKVVHPCKHSVRSITDVKSIKLKDGTCKVLSNNKYFSCSKCPRKDQYFVTSCIKGQLKLVTKYSVRRKGCCKFKIESRQFSCKKCPQKQVRRTRCSEGYRLRHVYYFVRANTNKQDAKHKVKCIKRVYSKKEGCNALRVCRDEMSSIDCNLFKKSGGCRHKEADAFRLCQATCGLC